MSTNVTHILSTFDQQIVQHTQELRALERGCRALRDKITQDLGYAMQAHLLGQRIAPQQQQNECQDSSNISIFFSALSVYGKQKADLIHAASESMLQDLNAFQETLKVQEQALKPRGELRRQLETQLAAGFEKCQKAREKYLRASRQCDELALNYLVTRAAPPNTGRSQTEKQERLRRLDARIEPLLRERRESESSYAQLLRQHNYNVADAAERVAVINDTIQQEHIQHEKTLRELVCKFMVDEISQIRNIQYDADAINGAQTTNSLNQSTIVDREYLHPLKGEFFQSCTSHLLEEVAAERYQSMHPKKEGSAENPSLAQSQQHSSQQLIDIGEKKESLLYNDERIQGIFYDYCIAKLRAQENLAPWGKTLQNIIKNQQFYEQLSTLSDYVLLCTQTENTSQKNDIGLAETPQQTEGKNNTAPDSSWFEQQIEQKKLREAAIMCLESIRQSLNPTQAELQAHLYTHLQKNIVVQALRASYSNSDLLSLKKLMKLVFTLYKLVPASLPNSPPRKVYLSQAFEYESLVQRTDLWEGVIYATIAEEAAAGGGASTNSEKSLVQVQSILLSCTMQMLQFKLESAEIKSMVVRFAQNFGLSDQSIKELLTFINNEGTSLQHGNTQNQQQPGQLKNINSNSHLIAAAANTQPTAKKILNFPSLQSSAASTSTASQSNNQHK